MAGPSVSYTFSNSTTADAPQVNQNFTDLVNGATDGTKDYSINALTVAGAATFNGAVTLGNSSGDAITFTGSLSSSVPVSANATHDVGGSTTGLRYVYLGNSTFTVRLGAGTMTASWNLSFPPAVAANNKSVMTFDTSGVASFEHRSIQTVVSKTNSDSPYTALATDELILCNATGGAITVNLPAAASSSGKTFTIKKTDSGTNAVTIDGNASETIDGGTTYAISTQYEAVTIVCDGSNWFII